jgi:signal transduction histidine kinase
VLNQDRDRIPLSSCVTAIVRIVCLVLLLHFPTSAQSNEPKKVLILMAEDMSWAAYRLIDENARTTLRAGLPGRILIFGEHLDRIYFPDPQLQAQQLAGIQRKYANTKIDLVIGVGDVPTDLFPGVPFLYVRTDPSRKRPSSPARSKDMGNVWIALDAQKTLDVARRLQPKARQVVVIGSSSVTGKNLFDQARDQIEADPHHLPVIYLTNESFSEICQKIATLGPESIVLYVSLSRDAHGGQFISSEIVSKLAAVSGAPMYVLLDSTFGSGAVGGYLVQFAEVGKQAGKMGLQILAGASPQDATAPSAYIFDWRQLRRWKIPESALPLGSSVLNRQPSVWELYWRYIVGAILLCLLETTLILGLLWQRTRRRRVEASLLDSLTFEHLLSDLSATFISLPEEQITETMENSLGRIAEFLRIERMAVHEFSRDGMEWTPTISWLKDGMQPPPTVVRRNQLPWLTNYFLRGESMFVSDVNELPAEALLEREHLRRLDAISVAIVSLKAGAELHSCISFISTQRRVLWTDELQKQLKLLGEIFSNALERKSAKESLEELSGRLLTAQDAERTRIARELHDDFSQRLALQGIGLAQVWKKLPESEVEERAKVHHLMKGLQEIASDMHSLSHQLHSSKLEHVGLAPALRGLCEELSSKFKIQIEFTEHEVSSRIPREVALCLFRIAQEALGNVIKHSGAKQAQAELYASRNEIRLRVVDTGLGFDPAVRNGGAGLGLLSMRERLRLVGGKLSVQSVPMRGTEILAAAPLSAPLAGRT